AKATHTYPIINIIAEKLNFKWIFRYFNTKIFFVKPPSSSSFISLLEATKINNTNTGGYFKDNIKLALWDEAIRYRESYYTNIVNNSKTDLDIFYSVSIFSNPDEYHADIMAQRNG